MAKLVSGIYGEALFETAMEEGGDRAAELLGELETIRTILEQNPQFNELMKHPGIPKPEKLSIIQTVFQGRISAELESFLEIVVEKDRYKELPAIFADYEAKVKEQQKIGTAYVTTAVSLTEEQRKAVEQRLLDTSGYLKMEMHFGEDPSLIGGMVIRVGDRVVDSSIRTRLDSLTKQLLKIQLG